MTSDHIPRSKHVLWQNNRLVGVKDIAAAYHPLVPRAAAFFSRRNGSVRPFDQHPYFHILDRLVCSIPIRLTLSPLCLSHVKSSSTDCPLKQHGMGGMEAISRPGSERRGAGHFLVPPSAARNKLARAPDGGRTRGRRNLRAQAFKSAYRVSGGNLRSLLFAGRRCLVPGASCLRYNAS